MSKEIKLQRSELVWETRVSYFTEDDFNHFIKKVEGEVKYYHDRIVLQEVVNTTNDNLNDRFGDLDYYTRMRDRSQVILDFLKSITWEQVVAEFSGERVKNDLPELLSGDIKGYDGHSYQLSLREILIEEMREQNYQAEVDDVDYADDYEEEIDIYESEDKCEGDDQ